MTATVVRPNGDRTRLLDHSWMLPAFAVVLLVIGAVAGLVNGPPAPDAIGATSLASTFLAVP